MCIMHGYFSAQNIKFTTNNGQCFCDDQTSSDRHSIIDLPLRNKPNEGKINYSLNLSFWTA